MTHNPKTTHPFEIVKPHIYQTPMFFVTAEVGDGECADLLLHNKEPKRLEKGTNRKPSDVVVTRYSRKMLAGLWHENPQPIVFVIAADGSYSVMGDGQQRLMAVRLAHKTQPGIRVKFTFCFDAHPDAMLVIDQNRKRVPADWLAMLGEANATQLSSAVKMLYAVLEVPFQGTFYGWQRVELPPETQIEFLDKHPDLRMALFEAKEAKNRINNYVGAVLWYLMWREYGVWTTNKFFEGMATGAIPSTEDPRLKTREYLGMRKEEKPTPYKWNGFELLGLLIMTSNAWLTGQENFVAKRAHAGVAGKKFPELITKEKLPKSMIVPGNDPATS